MTTHKLYHGTTKEAYDSIMQHGFNATAQIMVWNNSQDNMVYFWDADRLAEMNGNEDDNEDHKRHAAIIKALESATIAAALYSTADQIYVIECTIDDTAVTTLQPDQSGKMEDSGAMQIHWTEVQRSHITAVYVAPFSQRCALLYLTGLVDRDDDIDLYRHLQTFEIDILRTLAKANTWIDDLYEFDYAEMYFAESI